MNIWLISLVHPLYRSPLPVCPQRRAAFNELDSYLTRVIRDSGLRDQPTMAFLRWGFNQRSLQDPTRLDVDPLLPMDAAHIDACLTTELVRERMPIEKAHEVCRLLAERCKEKAQQLVQLKSGLDHAVLPPGARFDLLLPEESHLHSFSKVAVGADGAFRDRDLHTFNQNEREQYKIIYDWRGPNEYAIPLNHARFMQLQSDYRRTTGDIAADVKEDQLFLRRLWTMCARYDTISGAGYQAALPEESFEMLQRHWEVEHECYASPLNHCLDSFGSAFIETDRFFGSKGKNTKTHTQCNRHTRTPFGAHQLLSPPMRSA